MNAFVRLAMYSSASLWDSSLIRCRLAESRLTCWHRRTRPVRLEGLRVCIDLAQHDRVGFLLRHKDLELQGARLGRQATLGVSRQVLQVFVPLARGGLDSSHDGKFSQCVHP